jgi:Rha family phage regulatory protein
MKAGEVYAKSQDVAAYFGKRHADVLQDIDRLIKTGGGDLHRLMFQGVSAFDPRANREVRSFDMNRDGFALLVMGYTGPKALRFKLAYLDRFNAMEKQLREVPQVTAPVGIEQMMAAMTASMTTAIAQAMQAVLQTSGKAPTEGEPKGKRVIPESARWKSPAIDCP